MDFTTDVKPENLISLDLRGVYGFPKFNLIHTNTSTTQSTYLIDYIFKDIALLKEVMFPVGLAAVGKYTFQNCISLEKVDLAEAIHVESGGFHGCTSLTEVKGDKLERVHSHGFEGCEKLTDINLSNVTNVGDCAFLGCKLLGDVDIRNLTIIGANAFEDCVNMTIPDDVTLNFKKVEDFAFSDCNKLALHVDLTEATEVGSHAFNNCAAVKLTSGELDALETIGANAFYGCSEIGSLYEVEIPKVSTVGSSAFNGCSQINIVSGLSNLTSISPSAFQGCAALTGYAKGTVDGSLVLDKVTSVGAFGFSGCGALTKVEFDNTKLKSIEKHAFDNCRSLTSISGLEGVTSVGDYAFSSCGELTELNLDKATSAGANFISSCNNLEKIIMPKVTEDNFTYGENNTPGTISELIRGLKSTLREINVAGLKIAKLETFNIGWDDNGTPDNPNDNTNIPNKVLETINIAACKELASDVFYNCTTLKTVIATGATTIGSNVFYNCTTLKTVIATGATTIGSNVFYNCTALEVVDLSNLSTALPGWGGNFQDHVNLTTIDIASVPSIEAGTFSGCKKLTTVDASSAKSIGIQAFANCTNLVELDLRGVTAVFRAADYAGTWQYPFAGATTTNCTLTISNAQKANVPTGTTEWYGTEWKEIKYIE